MPPRILALTLLLCNCTGTVEVVPGCETSVLAATDPSVFPPLDVRVSSGTLELRSRDARVASRTLDLPSLWAAGARPQIVAHRGYRCCFPENTLEAIAGALALGAVAVELDVQFTQDGVPVLMHDFTVDRTTNGMGLVSEYTFSEIRKLDACSWFRPETPSCMVPTVREALQLANGRGQVLLDLKENGYCRLSRVLEPIREFAMLQDVGIISRDLAVLDSVRSYDPDIAVGFIVSDDFDVTRMARLGNAALFFDILRIRDERQKIEVARWKGLAVGIWTVERPEEIGPVVDLGIEWLLSDIPLTPPIPSRSVSRPR
jgi:glycerophosphoryl diester phosphodiesterase